MSGWRDVTHHSWRGSHRNDQVLRARAFGGSAMLEGVDSEPGPPPGRRRQIDTRLNAIRARLKQLRERDRAAAPRDRLKAARRQAAEAHAAAVRGLAAGAEAFRRAAEAHERAASVHERTAAAGIGDVREHERQAALHRAAAATDRQQAERAQLLLSEPEWAGPAAIVDEPDDGAAP
jgi:hypothetical protein